MCVCVKLKLLDCSPNFALDSFSDTNIDYSYMTRSICCVVRTKNITSCGVLLFGDVSSMCEREWWMLHLSVMLYCTVT